MRTSSIVVLTLLLSVAALAQAPAPPPYRVIVNSRNAVASVDRSFLAETFLKKVVRWPNGDAILPVDRDANSTVRRLFSEDVLKRSLPAIRSYWQQLIFSGRNVPPPELDSDAAVLEYVAKHKGAVGYVSGAAQGEGIKFVSVR
jgi:ABC-type phosphate transport system substrate-binding protein